MRLGSSSINDPLIGVSNDYAELCDLGKKASKICQIKKSIERV